MYVKFAYFCVKFQDKHQVTLSDCPRFQVRFILSVTDGSIEFNSRCMKQVPSNLRLICFFLFETKKS